ncbi:hypothetical protein POY80_14785 [Bacteroides uniformis]|uniref:Polysaccharide biosynthesis protein n=2 Tax=Bacteroidales TaxID=171549 RepID=A0AAW6G5M7_BACUN|nr:hypothetical protein [Bacteroides uniformis]MDC1753706.1 hypothetical protein [Bacteroides uniformis]
MFIGFMHFGFFQGGYRLIAYKHDESDQVNNIVFSFLGCLGVLLIAFALIFPVTGIDFIIGNQYLLLSVIAGIFTLATTWLTNTMTVKKMIPEINQIFAISGIVSIALIALVFVWGTFGGILSIMIQPVVFVTLALLRCKELRPTALYFSRKIVKNIIQLGFVPFCVGIFSILNIQIERWSIAYLLNVEDLGRFYLVFVFSSLFVLIPTSTQYLFFPKIISAYEHGQLPEFNRQSRNYTLVLAAYGVVTLLVVLTLFQPIVDVLFPMHSENTKYVYMLLPGFICNLLYYSVSSILNAWRDFKSLLLSGSIGVVASIVIIFVTARMGVFSLDTMVIIKNISYMLPMLFGATYIFIHRKKFTQK